jgi:DNA polymerase III subunit alpha
VSEIEFVNLHHLHHSTFSYGDGYGTPIQHVERAAALGYTAITATEHGGVSSHHQLEKAAKKAGIKPIFGVEGYCGSVETETRGQFKHHLTILASSQAGYRNLNEIVSQSYRDYYYHPTISGRSLLEHRDGLVVLSGCSGSLLACSLLGGKGTPEKDVPDLDAARAVIDKFSWIFGDNYYIEIQPFYELDRTIAMNTAYEELSKESGVPLVVTCDVHYPTMDDAEMQAVLHAVHRGKASVDDAMREWNYDVPLTLPSDDSALADRLVKTGISRHSAEIAIRSSASIAAQCNVTLPKAERLRYPIQEADKVPWLK